MWQFFSVRSPTDSETESEDEQILWHEQRRRIKEALKKGESVANMMQEGKKYKQIFFF